MLAAFEMHPRTGATSRQGGSATPAPAAGENLYTSLGLYSVQRWHVLLVPDDESAGKFTSGQISTSTPEVSHKADGKPVEGTSRCDSTCLLDWPRVSVGRPAAVSLERRPW